jgi:enamine deaminase RidA (YjgF/YER057c/UK114 family)
MVTREEASARWQVADDIGRPPASTLVEVSALAHPDWMVEIEAIAVL